MGWEIIWDNKIQEMASLILDDLSQEGIPITRDNEKEIRSYVEDEIEAWKKELSTGGYEYGYEHAPTDIEAIVECIFWLGNRDEYYKVGE